MRRLTVALFAAVIYWLVRLILAFCPDRLLLMKIRATRRILLFFAPGHEAGVVLNDLSKIFIDREASRLARRFILDARPEQVKATLRGVLG